MKGFPDKNGAKNGTCKRSLSIVNENSIPVGCISPVFDRFCARM